MSGTQVDPSDPAHPDHADYLISTNGWRAVPVDYADEPLFESTVQSLLGELDGHYRERCGFITKEDQQMVQVRNSHGEPHANFYMEEEDAEASIHYIYEECHDSIMGIYHTHPNGYPWPSPRDIRGWPNLSLGWRYFLVSRGNVTEWRLVRD